MKTKTKSRWARLCLLQASCFQFPRVVILTLFAAFLLPAQITVAAEALDKEAQYQKALKKGQEAQADGFYVSALISYEEALALKPGDEVAAKLKSDMQAKVTAPTFGAEPATAAAKPAKRGAKPPKPAPEPPAQVGQPMAATTAPEVQPGQPAPEVPGAVPPAPKAPKATKNEISVSGDFFMGQGNITLPIGYSMAGPLGSALDVKFKPTVANPERDSTYFGGTLSYSFGQAWYLDLSYAQGSSSGNFSFDTGDNKNLDATFTLDDTWYQAYLRYTFPRLRGKRLSAYLRAGASYVTADMTAGSVLPALGLYTQTDQATDILGNAGFGVGYSLYTSRRFRAGLQVEAEGFYGTRTQDSLENLPQVEGFNPESVTIDNALYGGIGRATVRMEYRLGRSGLFKIFADGGFQAKYTLIEYPDASAPNELLWGPYAKLGLRYSF